MEAVFHDDAAGVVRAICERGADAQLADYLHRNGARPVHMAAINRNWNALTALLANGASINGGDSRGRTPLHLLARQGDEAAVRRLLLEAHRAGQEVAIESQTLGTLNTPLHLAVRSSSVDLVVLLLEQAAESHRAAQKGVLPSLPPCPLAAVRAAADDGLAAVRTHLASLWASQSHRGPGLLPVKDAARVLPGETVLASALPAAAGRAAVAAEAEARRRGQILAGDGIGMPRDGREMGGGPASGSDMVSRLLLGARWKDVEADPTVEAVKRSKAIGRALPSPPRPPAWLGVSQRGDGGGAAVAAGKGSTPGPIAAEKGSTPGPIGAGSSAGPLGLEAKDAAVLEAAAAREDGIRGMARDEGVAAAEAWAGAHAAADEDEADEDMADAASVLANGATTPRPELLQGNDFGEMLAQEAAAERARQNLGRRDRQMQRPRGAAGASLTAAGGRCGPADSWRVGAVAARAPRVEESTTEPGEPATPWLCDAAELGAASGALGETVGLAEALRLSLPPPSVVDARTSLGETPLLLACRLGNAPAASALVAAGADVNARTACGRTALGLAGAGGFTSLAASLIEVCGASLYRWEDAAGSTSLEMSARLGDPGMAMGLLALEERLRREAAEREEQRRRNAEAAAAVAEQVSKMERARHKKAQKEAREARQEAEDRAYLAKCREIRKTEAREHKEGLLALANVRSAARRREKEAARERFEKRQQARLGGV